MTESAYSTMLGAQQPKPSGKATKLTTKFTVPSRRTIQFLAFIATISFWAQLSSAQQLSPAPYPLDEATDNGLTWTTSSYNSWVGQTNVTHDGSDAAALILTNSPYFSDTYIQTTVQGPARVSFWWMSDASALNFQLQYDGTKMMTPSQIGVWCSNYLDVPYGSHTLKWSASYYWYYSHFTLALDQVTVTPLQGDPPQVTVSPTATTIGIGQPLSIHATATGTDPLHYSWAFKSAQAPYPLPPPTPGSSNFVINSVQRSNAGTYTVYVQNLFGTATASSVVTASLDGLAESLDTTNLQWSLSGSSDWVPETSVTHDGVDAVRSPSTSYYQSYALITQVEGPASVKYFAKYSPNLLGWSESLTVNIDNGQAKAYDAANGGFDWKQDEVIVPFGTHMVNWSINSGSYGGGVAWLDQVTVDPLTGDAPAITSQSSDATVAQGDEANFQVVATGTPDLFYQWYWNDQPLYQETNSTLQLFANTINAGTYTVAVSNIFGIATSHPINLAVTPSPISLHTALDDPNLIWFTPSDSSWYGQSRVTHDHRSAAAAGPNSLLQTTVVGPGVLTFWWKSTGEIDFQDFYSQTQLATYYGDVADTNWQLVTVGISAGPRVIVWYSNPDAVSYLDSVHFTPQQVAPPKIVQQPRSQAVDVDGTATLSVKANAVGPVTYQWSFNGSDIYDGTDSSCVISDVTPDLFGYYSVRVMNPFGTAYSEPVLLTQKNDIGSAIGDPGVGWIYDPGSWNTQNQIKHGQAAAIQSQPTYDSSASAIDNTVTGPGTLSFWWRVSSETNYDLLQFSINGEVQATISGNTGWRYCKFRVPAGTAGLDWMYSKDGDTAWGLDCGWISGVVFTPDPAPSIRIVPHEQTVYEGSVARFHTATNGSVPLNYDWQDSAGNDFGNSPDLKLVSASMNNAGTYSVTAYGSFANDTDSAILHVKPAVDGVRALMGNDIRLKLNTTGDTPSTYTWFDGNQNPLTDDGRITGSTNSILTVRATTVYDAGNYSVYAANDRTGYVWAPAATVSIIQPGPIVGWGIDDYTGGEGIFCPSDLNDALAICTGTYASMALLPDRTVRAWWNNGGYDLDVPYWLTDVTAIGMGLDYSAAITSNGSVWEWPSEDANSAQQILSDAKSISVGPDHILTINRDGTVSNWGYDEEVPADVKGITGIAAGNGFDLAVTRSGKIIAWGDNSYGQLMPPRASDVVAVAAGDRHGLALRKDGTVVAWGDNSNGQTNVPPGLKKVVAIAAGSAHSVALTSDGTVVAWGGTYNYAGLYSSTVPVGLRNVAQISAAGSHTLALIYAPTIINQPQVQSADDPNFFTINVDAGGRVPLYYDWRLNGHVVKTTTDPLLVLHVPSTAQSAANQNYDVVVRNRYGSIVSQRVNVGASGIIYFDSTVGLQDTSVNGSTAGLSVTNVAGLVAPPPPPPVTDGRLQIVKQGESVAIAWPAVSGLILETADSVQGPWTAVAATNSTNSVSVPFSAQQKFYRLRATAN